MLFEVIGLATKVVFKYMHFYYTHVSLTSYRIGAVKAKITFDTTDFMAERNANFALLRI